MGVPSGPVQGLQVATEQEVAVADPERTVRTQFLVSEEQVDPQGTLVEV